MLPEDALRFRRLCSKHAEAKTATLPLERGSGGGRAHASLSQGSSLSLSLSLSRQPHSSPSHTCCETSAGSLEPSMAVSVVSSTPPVRTPPNDPASRLPFSWNLSPRSKDRQ